MTQPSDIEQKIQSILNDRLQIEAPTVDQDLFQTGILDSLSFVDVLVALEDEFSVKIALDLVDLNDFRSIAQIAHYVSLQANPNHEVALGRHSAV